MNFVIVKTSLWAGALSCWKSFFFVLQTRFFLTNSFIQLSNNIQCWLFYLSADNQSTKFLDRMTCNFACVLTTVVTTWGNIKKFRASSAISCCEQIFFNQPVYTFLLITHIQCSFLATQYPIACCLQAIVPHFYYNNWAWYCKYVYIYRARVIYRFTYLPWKSAFDIIIICWLGSLLS